MTEIEARKGLKDKMIKFIEIIYKNPKLDQGKAYSKAGYKATGMSAHVSASKLLKNPKCVRYLNYLRSKTTKKSIKTASQVQEDLSELMDSAKLEGDYTGFKGLSSELSKMRGYYEPEKVDVSVGFFTNIPKSNGLGRR